MGRYTFTESEVLPVSATPSSPGRRSPPALATIARMGWESFTVRMLQEATGLSYHQVRRILQGYTARGTTYCGLLEKCPALAVVDTTVIGESTGTTVRRHELHFQFDARRYREWVAELAVWLEDEGEGEDDSSLPSDNSCNTVATVANGVRPLSGVLDPRTFARVKVELGRCEICDTGKAVYRSREAQTKICEGCYARLVREGNAREGGAVNDGS